MRSKTEHFLTTIRIDGGSGVQTTVSADRDGLPEAKFALVLLGLTMKATGRTSFTNRSEFGWFSKTNKRMVWWVQGAGGLVKKPVKNRTMR